MRAGQELRALSLRSSVWPLTQFVSLSHLKVMPLSVTAAHARRLALRTQGLDGTWRPGRGVDGAAATIERLGYVQIDTIAVIERAHEHIFWTRQPAYRPTFLHQLMQQRRVFECWTHAASYVPMIDYRFYCRRRRWDAGGGQRGEWLRDNRRVVTRVRARITDEGPLAAADFQDGDTRRGPWWDWKPAKKALEALYDAGELMIAERRGFQRVYDLTERVLPADLDLSEPDAAATARWAVHRTLDNLGLADLRQMHIWHGDRDLMQTTVEQLVDAGELCQLQVRGDSNAPQYARPDDVQATASGRATRRVHLLSPFDNLVIRRPWLQRLFDFDYTIECYVPAPKRRYGYFCLPVLFGNSLVGRLDPKADRKTRTFIVRRLELEPDFTAVDALLTPLADKLWRFAQFNGCDTVKVERVVPGRVLAPLRQALQAGRP